MYKNFQRKKDASLNNEKCSECSVYDVCVCQTKGKKLNTYEYQFLMKTYGHKRDTKRAEKNYIMRRSKFYIFA